MTNNHNNITYYTNNNHNNNNWYSMTNIILLFLFIIIMNTLQPQLVNLWKLQEIYTIDIYDVDIYRYIIYRDYVCCLQHECVCVCVCVCVRACVHARVSVHVHVNMCICCVHGETSLSNEIVRIQIVLLIGKLIITLFWFASWSLLCSDSLAHHDLVLIG